MLISTFRQTTCRLTISSIDYPPVVPIDVKTPRAPPDTGFTNNFLSRASYQSGSDLAWTGGDGMYVVTKGSKDFVAQLRLCRAV